MRIRLWGAFWTFACALAGLALPQQSRAQDDTNAALIIDGTVWAQSMHQVMGGASTLLAQPGSVIRGPAGVYVVVQLSFAIKNAQKVVDPSGRPMYGETQKVDDALTTYYGYLLDNAAVSGLMLLAQWQDLQPLDPGPNPTEPNSGSFAFHYLKDAFDAINAWNTAHPAAEPKTLQLVVTPGFNSPLKPPSDWLLKYLSSCDFLFGAAVPMSSSCGYTTIFYQTENKKDVAQMPLPMPWNTTYKAYWKAFVSNLSDYIASDPSYVSSFVSIGVAGPTASSAEMILPNGKPGTSKNPSANCPGVPPASQCGTLTLPGVPGSASVNVWQAWNCLLGNAYGVAGNCLLPGYGASANSPYINSDRAFVEEWAAAIDMFGEAFSGVTLTAITGDGLPDFDSPLNPAPVLKTSPLLVPPPAFAPDCGTLPGAAATVDCAAETAILAYFAGPPVGGANAKATEEDGLTARGINGGVLSGASVKWLSKNTNISGGSGRLPVLDTPGSGNGSVVSRMLGGLQFAQSFYENPEFEGCTPGTTCTIKLEQALFNMLKAYFAGTSAGSSFGQATVPNGSETVADAPINYMQIWDADIRYAAGWANCTWQQLMTAPAKPAGPPPGCMKDPRSMNTVYVPPGPLLDGGKMTAQKLLNAASSIISSFTYEVVSNPIFCCNPPSVPRGAFQGDPVCVTQKEAGQVLTDNNNAAAGTTYSSNYTDKAFYNGYTFVPGVPNGIVPYGRCTSGLRYRQAYMGDYVCVTHKEAGSIKAQNAASYPVIFCTTPPVPPFPRPLPLPR